jgi:hypothetical protein
MGHRRDTATRLGRLRRRPDRAHQDADSRLAMGLAAAYAEANWIGWVRDGQ